jgi:hypothetical protein
VKVLNLLVHRRSKTDRERGHKNKAIPLLNEAPRHEDALGYWRYSSTLASHRRYIEVSGQLYAPAALPQGKSSWYPLDGGLGGPQRGW